MSEKETQAKSEKEQRKPYVKPAVISSEIFETMALSCAQSGFLCPPSNPDRS